MYNRKIYTSAIKKEAKKLRLQGWSYRRIGNKIGVPKSTLSTWLKKVPLLSKFRERLYTKQVEMITRGEYSQKNRRAKEVIEIIKHAKIHIPKVLEYETYRFIGVALYWAEGTKKGLFEITNSDPKLILFMIKWINKIFNIPSNKLRARLNIHKNQTEEKIIEFWSKLCGIPKKNFSKSFIKPANKNYKKNILYYGTIKITIEKSTDLKYTTLAWLDSLLPNISKKVELISEQSKLNRP